ncbi:MAG: SRPBCC domain-containing protein [Sphingobacteriales bacterium JAD_PAG50586_3]|nr:MAG: SRPBCC domain-containing protein [Sphingobacteriales bacterium JAD_PAG50586_3]
MKFSGEFEGNKYQDKGTVLENHPHELLKYTYWSSMGGVEDKAENYVIVTYKLTTKGASTLLEITQENIPDEKSRKHSEKNWGTMLQNLKEFIEKGAELSTEEDMDQLGGE